MPELCRHPRPGTAAAQGLPRWPSLHDSSEGVQRMAIFSVEKCGVMRTGSCDEAAPTGPLLPISGVIGSRRCPPPGSGIGRFIMVPQASNSVPALVPPLEQVQSSQVQILPEQSSARDHPENACFVSSTTSRRTYDLIAPSRPQPRSKSRSSRRYSRHATSILMFFQYHRIALASHVQRQFPDLFQTDRSTRMHLQTLVARGVLL